MIDTEWSNENGLTNDFNPLAKKFWNVKWSVQLHTEWMSYNQCPYMASVSPEERKFWAEKLQRGIQLRKISEQMHNNFTEIDLKHLYLSQLSVKRKMNYLGKTLINNKIINKADPSANSTTNMPDSKLLFAANFASCQ